MAPFNKNEKKTCEKVTTNIGMKHTAAKNKDFSETSGAEKQFVKKALMNNEKATPSNETGKQIDKQIQKIEPEFAQSQFENEEKKHTTPIRICIICGDAYVNEEKSPESLVTTFYCNKDHLSLFCTKQPAAPQYGAPIQID